MATYTKGSFCIPYTISAAVIVTKNETLLFFLFPLTFFLSFSAFSFFLFLFLLATVSRMRADCYLELDA